MLFADREFIRVQFRGRVAIQVRKMNITNLCISVQMSTIVVV